MDPIQFANLSRAHASIGSLIGEGKTRDHQVRTYTRSIIARALGFARIDSRPMDALAAALWGSSEGPAIAKAATGALTGEQTAEHDAFFGVVADTALVGRLPIRRWPFRVRGLTGAGLTGGEVSENDATPIRAQGVDSFRLDAGRKFQAATLATREGLQRGGAAIERAIETALRRAVVDAVDAAFVADLTAAATSSGFDGDHRFAVYLLNPADLEIYADQRLDVTGGWFRGHPAFISDAVPSGQAVFCDASQVAADWGDGYIDFATEAAIQAADNPTQDSATPTPTDAVSMFQTNSVAIRGTMHADWHIAAGAVEVITLVP